MPILIYIYKT